MFGSFRLAIKNFNISRLSFSKGNELNTGDTPVFSLFKYRCLQKNIWPHCMHRYIQYILNSITRCNLAFLFTDNKGFYVEYKLQDGLVWHPYFEYFIRMWQNFFFPGRSSEFGQTIFIVSSFYRSTTNIKELNMVVWPEAGTAMKEDENLKYDHRIIPQYIAYIKKNIKRKDSTNTNNILDEFNEKGWIGDIGNDENVTNEQY